MSKHGALRKSALLGRPSRVDRLRRFDQAPADLVDRLLLVARTGLPGMQRADGTACLARSYSAARVIGQPEGCSLRYTAVTVLGARHLDTAGQRAVLAGRTAAGGCDVLVERLSSTNSIGDAALAVWTTAACGHEGLPRALARLDALDAGPGARRVVDLAWTISALVAARSAVDVERRLDRARSRLLESLVGPQRLFGHLTEPTMASHHRRHVGCFGDQVYPIQALARLHASADDSVALGVAERCAEQICHVQGPAGQWWWHYDNRTGRVVEGYPVYTVHQHALAPMALLDLAEAGGSVHLDAIGRGLAWLVAAPEVSEPLILDRPGLIARKVDRGDPGKVVRGLRALAAGVRPGTRLSRLDRLWPPTVVHRECRPDELGWLLDCWLGGLGSADGAGVGAGSPGRTAPDDPTG
jgi:hypothetical protein